MEPLTIDGGGDGSEERLLPQSGNGDHSWRLNFDGFQLSSDRKEKPPRGIHDCLGVLGSHSFALYPCQLDRFIFLRGFDLICLYCIFLSLMV